MTLWASEYDVRVSEFLIPGDRRGVVLVHGFTGTPATVRYLGDRLGAAGFCVRGLQLPGHGSTVDALAESSPADWERAVVHAVDRLAMSCDHVAVVGFSMGGLLALRASLARPLAAVATLATPLWLASSTHWIARASDPRWLGRWLTHVPKVGGVDARSPAPGAVDGSYARVPTKSLRELVALMATVRAQLPLVTTPLLVLHSAQDHTAPVACALELAQAARAERLRIFENSYHLLAADVDRDAVATEVCNFLERHLGKAHGENQP